MKIKLRFFGVSIMTYHKSEHQGRSRGRSLSRESDSHGSTLRLAGRLAYILDSDVPTEQKHARVRKTARVRA
jgi:hypothetical protein